MHNIIQLQGIHLIWKKIELPISNKKKNIIILSKLCISTNLILCVNRKIMQVNQQKCMSPRIPCAIYNFHGFSRFFMGVIKFPGFSRLVDTML